jgi:hypothetical protein
MKNKKNTQSNTNQSIVYRMWKRHKHQIALIATLGCLATAGIGAGVGYVI